MIPGMNLLAMALTVIASNSVNYFAFAARVTQANGVDLTTYHPFVTITQGCTQAVDRSLYKEYGLDWEKTYIVWYVPNLNASDIARDTSADVIEVDNGRYQLAGGTDWFKRDGWKSFLGVLIGPATGALNNA